MPSQTLTLKCLSVSPACIRAHANKLLSGIGGCAYHHACTSFLLVLDLDGYHQETRQN